MKVIVTGGAGFIGSNFIFYMMKKHPDYEIICLDKLTYAGNLSTLKSVLDKPNFKFVKLDICDRDGVYKLFEEEKPDVVVNFAAESHVDNSISGPRAFIETNISCTFNLLEAARKHWFDEPSKPKAGYEDCRFHHISTDEVYGTLGDDGMFEETTPYAPNSPYSASKASSDFLVRAYHHTFGMNVTTSNCSNNYGPKQNHEKLIPHIIENALNLKPPPISGQGLNVRDWLYVLDHCKAVDLIFHKGVSGETYNIGGHNERNNITIVNTICNILDKECPRADGKKYADLITFVKDRAGHDLRYAIDPEKISKELNWVPDETFDTGIVKTVKWYLEKYQK